MTRRRTAIAIGIVITIATLSTGCARDAVTPGSRLATGTWRGDVQVPGSRPAIGVQFDVADSAGVQTLRMRAAPNMGFGGATMTGLRVGDDGIDFDWTRQGETRHCALRLIPDAYYLGPCTIEGEADFAMRMVPPGVDAPAGLTRSMVEMSSIHWIPSEHGPTRVYGPSDADSSFDRAAVAATIARAREDNRALLGDSALTHPLTVFIVGERDVMRRLVGRPSGGWTDPMSSTVLATRWGSATNALRHETGHALQFNVWGPPYKGTPMLGEGLATWLAGTCRGHAVHALVADVDSADRRIPMNGLYHDFYNQDDLIAYLQSASVMGYVLETYGADGLRGFWSEGEGWLTRSNVNLAALETGWLAFLRSVEPAGADWVELGDGGCG